MLRDVDIALLRAFTAVVETGSVTAAARLLNRTQAAVSLQIKRLEDTFGKTLFDRAHRRMILTPEGEHLVAAAQRIVALNDELVGRMTTPEFSGEVRLGVPTDLVHAYIPPILRRFAQSWPHVRVSLLTGNSALLLDKMHHGDADLVLTTDAAPDPAAETLRLDELRWTGAPGGAAHRLDPLPLAVGDTSCRFRPAAIEALRKAGRDWRMVLEVSGQAAQDATVSAGIAIGISMRDSVHSALVLLDESAGLPPLPAFYINMHAPRPGANTIADELARHIRQEFAVRFGSISVSGKRPRPKAA
jgi:DNA-binding transcriptional LysR family regulator